jgi:glycosyltransferase involved in cell wall biosynthesis/peptidoglycan/xylan/chitin deacetylase (PgdA/CDA1 family)
VSGVKQRIAGLLGGMPLLGRAFDWLRATGAPVFMFHRVLPEGEASYDPELVTSTNPFGAFLDWVGEQYHVVAVDELARRCQHPKEGGAPLCAITFDDGWRDNFLHALPLLRQRQLTATIFLPVRFIGTERRFWPERLRVCLEELDNRNEAESTLQTVMSSFPWCPQLPFQEKKFERLRRILLHRPSCEAEEFVDFLATVTGPLAALTGRAFLDWAEVRAMQDAGITFGSGTLHHTLLTRAEPAIVEREIQESRRELTERLGAPPVGFAYPWGATGSYIRERVKASGYECAVTTREGMVRGGSDPWLLPRIPISNSSLRGVRGSFGAGRTNFYLASRALRKAGAKRLLPEGKSRPTERLRLALVIDAIDSWEAGGTEQQVGKLLAALGREYFEPELYFLRPSAHLTPADFPCPVHLASSRLDWYRARLKTLTHLTQLFRRHQPHIVQTFFRDGTYYGTVAAWAARVPAIVICRRNAGHWKTALDRLALNVINRLADAWQCNSRTALESLTAEGVPASRIEILPNAINVERFSVPTESERLAARKQLGAEPSAPLFVSVANLTPVKDPRTVVKAAIGVCRMLPAAQFYLVGEGPLRGDVESLIRKSWLDGKVHLVGVQSDVRPFLAAADVGILASLSEGSSNALLEYMAMGLPTVVSDIPGNRNLVEGAFFAPGNARDLAERVLCLWNNPELRARIQVNSRRQVMQYSVEAFARRAQSYYVKLGSTMTLR